MRYSLLQIQYLILLTISAKKSEKDNRNKPIHSSSIWWRKVSSHPIIDCKEGITCRHNALYGLYVDIPPIWCGCLAHVVRVVCTCGAEGMHHTCGGLKANGIRRAYPQGVVIITNTWCAVRLEIIVNKETDIIIPANSES